MCVNQEGALLSKTRRAQTGEEISPRSQTSESSNSTKAKIDSDTWAPMNSEQFSDTEETNLVPLPGPERLKTVIPNGIKPIFLSNVIILIRQLALACPEVKQIIQFRLRV